MRNKDDFEARVKAIFREPKKTRIKCAIFYIGIDNIKQLKSTFGQAASKRILQLVENEIAYYCNQFVETTQILNAQIHTYKSYESSYVIITTYCCVIYVVFYLCFYFLSFFGFKTMWSDSIQT